MSEETKKTGGETILLVEDQEDVGDVAQDMLETLGYTVLRAPDAARAADIIDSDQHIDLLFTDIVMPGGMNGFELARQVRETNPAAPIIFMSGYTGYSKADISEIDAPMLQKPCPPAELADAIALELAKATPDD